MLIRKGCIFRNINEKNKQTYLDKGYKVVGGSKETEELGAVGSLGKAAASPKEEAKTKS